MLDKQLQKEIVQLFKDGYSVNEISEIKGVSGSTVRDYVCFFYNVHSIKEAKNLCKKD